MTGVRLVHSTRPGTRRRWLLRWIASKLRRRQGQTAIFDNDPSKFVLVATRMGRDPAWVLGYRDGDEEGDKDDVEGREHDEAIRMAIRSTTDADYVGMNT